MSRRLVTPLLILIAIVAPAFYVTEFGFESFAATINVTNLNDSGAGSLRQAIANAAPGDTITFGNLTGTINLTSGQLVISKNLKIQGPGSPLITVARSSATGTPTFRIFSISANQTVTISGLTISNGAETSSTGGGGILNAGNLTVDSCVISGNFAFFDGGGIYNRGTSTLLIKNSTVAANNSSAGNGGGIFSSSTAAVAMTVESCTISGNLSDFRGGGIETSGRAFVQNSTISGNTTGCRGGGISVAGDSPFVDITRSTITENKNTHAVGSFICGGGGIANSGTTPDNIRLGGTIVANNFLQAGIGVDILTQNEFDVPASPVTSLDFNLIGNPSGAQFTGPTSHNITNVNAKLRSLQDNGGPTKTHALQDGSPAIDRGTNSDAPAFDQRGAPRISSGNSQGDAVADIGAFELQRYIVTNTSDGGPGSLREALTNNGRFGGGLVRFNIPNTDSNCAVNGPCRILPTSLLPSLRPVDIDGYSQPGSAQNSSSGPDNNARIRVEISGTSVSGQDGLFILGNGSRVQGLALTAFHEAIRIEGASGCTVYGNYLGLSAAGIAGANDIGIALEGGGDNTIGGTLPSQINVISGNSKGIEIRQGSNSNSIGPNYIGLDLTGLAPLPNSEAGIRIESSNLNQVFGNRIAFNTNRGISVVSGTGNWIRSNQIYGNGSLGIDLGENGVTSNDPGDVDAGANNLQNFPVINYAAYNGEQTIVRGVLNTAPAPTTFVFLEFFVNSECDGSGNGEGQSLIGSSTAVTDANGNVSFDLGFPSADTTGKFITATATIFTNTSEFSACSQVVASPGNIAFSSADYSVNEAAEIVTINVNRTTGTGAVSVDYATSNGPSNSATGGVSCSAGVDYISANGTLSWADGDSSSKAVTITVCNDHALESSELLTLSLSNATGGATIVSPNPATLTILDNDAPGTVEFTVASYNANENDANATITVSRSGVVDSGPVSVNYATVSGGTANGATTCANGADYLNTSGTLVWDAGDVAPKTFSLPLCQDIFPDGEKTVNLQLTAPTGGALLGSQFTSLLHIADDEMTFTITNLNDSGSGSLRQAIIDANLNTGNDQIEFAPGLTGVIDLLSPLPEISNSGRMIGPGANVLTVRRSLATNTPQFRIFVITEGTTLNVEKLTIANGVGAGGGGGILNNGFLSLIQCAISANNTTGVDAPGGGIWSVGPRLAIANSTVSGNSATGEGGGIFVAGDLQMNQTTVSHNSATSGGGLACPMGSGSATVTRSTIANNTASIAAGGIYDPDNSSGFMLANTIVAENVAPVSPDLQGDVTSLDFNFFGNSSGATFSGLTTHNLVNLDARLGPLQNNGGPTATHALRPDSPAIDAGSNDRVNSFSRDQRSKPRVVDGDVNGSAIADIGAYELNAATVTNTNDTGAGSLRQALANNNADAIKFAPTVTGTINVVTPLPSIAGRVSLAGPGANVLTLRRADGASQFSILQVTSSGVLNLSGLTLSNGSTQIEGGGIFNEGDVTVDNCTIRDNFAAEGGGGISNVGSMILRNSSVVENSSAGVGINSGGGLTNGGTLQILNSTISGNIAGVGHVFGFGGGVLNSGNLTISRSTITNNTATSQPGLDAGGGIHNSFSEYPVRMGNTIVAGNTGTTAPDLAGAVMSLDYNLVGNTAGATITGATTHNLYNVRAQLMPLADNGGPTLTHALLVSSPALDAGSNSDAGEFDQRGLPRIADGNSDGSVVADIGAFELQPAISCATDVTSRLTIVRGGFRLNFTTGRFVQTVKITNSGTNDVSGPLAFALDNLSRNATLFDANGTTSCSSPSGSPFLELNAGPDGVLSAGESITVTLQFSNSTNGPITYAYRVLSGAAR